MTEKLRILTIRLPDPVWRKLRELQTDGEIKSINQAVLVGLALLIEQIEGRG